MSNSMVVFVALASMPILMVMSADGDPCSWCMSSSEPNIASCGVTDSAGWTLARAIGPTKGTWFATTDGLFGDAPWADNGVDQYNIGSFSAAAPDFNQFLFVTGDCSSWLITSTDAVGGRLVNPPVYYGNQDRTICASSISPNAVSTAKWYYRSGVAEDPWISTTDHHGAIGAGQIVYGENNFGSTHASAVIPANKRNGVYVYIRSVTQDANGCGTPDPCSACGACDDCINDECAPRDCSDGLYCNGEEYCDILTDLCEIGVEVSCPQNMYCDNEEQTCVRDCDSFAIDEYLSQCSDEFASDRTAMTEVQTHVGSLQAEVASDYFELTSRCDEIDGNITDISAELGSTQGEIDVLQTEVDALEGRATTIDASITTINNDLAFIHDRIDAFAPFDEASTAANADESTVIEDAYGNEAFSYFDHYKDALIIGLLLMNMVTMVVSCYLYSQKNKNRAYRVVTMQESEDEERALKQ